MRAAHRVEIEVYADEEHALAAMPDEVREGLALTPKQLPSKYFYDATGSTLFEEITRLPEYYLTRAEQEILEARALEIARITGVRDLIELGSGSSRKTRLLIEAGLDHGTLERYIPVEVSQKIAERSARALSEDYPKLAVHAIVGDFEHHLKHVPDGSNRLIAFLGSSIGNFPDRAGTLLLRETADLLRNRGYLLLGTDLVKDPAVLEAAYNDDRGVTASFNRNILNVINRYLDGDFDPQAFAHVSRYNSEAERIETYLVSTRDQTVRLQEIELEVFFHAGEEMCTEVSCKYTRQSVETLFEASGMVFEHWMTDARERFALSLARPL